MDTLEAFFAILVIGQINLSKYSYIFWIVAVPFIVLIESSFQYGALTGVFIGLFLKIYFYLYYNEKSSSNAVYSSNRNILLP